MARRVRGDRGFSKLMKLLPDAAREEAATILQEAGVAYQAAQRADAPVRTGALRLGLSLRLLRKSLKLRVGLVGSPGQRRKLFYGWIIERGRSAQTVTVSRATARGGRLTYDLPVKARRAQPFVFKRRPEIQSKLKSRLDAYWNRVLSRTAAGESLD